MSEMEIHLREVYKIPTHYYYMQIGEKHIFSFCDSDITIGPDGQAWESHMGLNSDATGHQFYTVRWEVE